MARFAKFLIAPLLVLLFSSFIFAQDGSSGSGVDSGSGSGSIVGGSDSGSEDSTPGSGTGSDSGIDDSGSGSDGSGVQCVEDSDCVGPVNFTQCCGGQCMDTRRNVCIKDRKCPLITNNVCNQTCYNSSRLSCFNKSILCKSGWSLCGSRCFNPAVQFCGGNSKVCNASNQWYCPEANRCFNHDKNYCCATSKQICPLSTMGQPNDTCCPAVPVAQGCNRLKPVRCGFNVTNPNKCYSHANSTCYNDETMCQLTYGYCGGRCYNTNRTYCPDGKNLCTFSQWFCPEAAKCYDPSVYYCCPIKNRLCLNSSTNCCTA